MRTINKVLFAFKEATKGIVKNFSKTFLQFLICFISLVFFSVVFGIYYNVQDVAKDMKDKIEISVFVRDDATEKEILDIEKAIKNNNNVKTYEYISKEDARKKGESIFEGMPEMIEAIDDLSNPFPSSFNIELIDANLTEEIAKSFTSMEGVEVDGVKYGEEYMDKILSLSGGLTIASYLALAFFFVIAIFFMISIINIVIAQKQEESEIMFMIGASPIQITFPFYLQGLFIGIFSSSLAYFTFSKLYNFLSKNLSFVLSDLSKVKIILLGFMILTGVISGLLATKIALHNFNKISRKVSRKTK